MRFLIVVQTAWVVQETDSQSTIMPGRDRGDYGRIFDYPLYDLPRPPGVLGWLTQLRIWMVHMIQFKHHGGCDLICLFLCTTRVRLRWSAKHWDLRYHPPHTHKTSRYDRTDPQRGCMNSYQKTEQWNFFIPLWTFYNIFGRTYPILLSYPILSGLRKYYIYLFITWALPYI